MAGILTCTLSERLPAEINNRQWQKCCSDVDTHSCGDSLSFELNSRLNRRNDYSFGHHLLMAKIKKNIKKKKLSDNCQTAS